MTIPPDRVTPTHGALIQTERARVFRALHEGPEPLLPPLVPPSSPESHGE